MRVMVVLNCSVLLDGRLWSGHGGKSHSKHECKVVLFSTVIVSITFVIKKIQVLWIIFLRFWVGGFAVLVTPPVISLNLASHTQIL